MTSSTDIRLKRDQSQELLDDLYSNEKDYYWYLRSPQYMETFLKPLAEEVLQCGNSVLDVGCGEGQLVKAIDGQLTSTSDFFYYGFDASEEAISHCESVSFQNLLEPHFKVDRFESHEPEQTFDTVVFGNILSVLVWRDSHLPLIRRYLEMTNARYFIVYELNKFPTQHIQKEFKLINEHHLEVDMQLEPVKRKRKIEVYEV